MCLHTRLDLAMFTSAATSTSSHLYAYGTCLAVVCIGFIAANIASQHKTMPSQVIATILSNWGVQWFTHFPQPPLPVLGQFGELLALHDPDLFQALSSGELPAVKNRHSSGAMQVSFLQCQPQHKLIRASLGIFLDGRRQSDLQRHWHAG